MSFSGAEILQEFVESAHRAADASRARRSVFLSGAQPSWSYRPPAKVIRVVASSKPSKPQRTATPDEGRWGTRGPWVARELCEECGHVVERREGFARVFHIVEGRFLPASNRCPIVEVV